MVVIFITLFYTYILTHKILYIKNLTVMSSLLERKTRFELATFALARQRSTTEPLPHKLVGIIGLEPMTICL